MHLPPPVHGESVMNQTIHESKLINENFNFKTIPLHFTTLSAIGKPSINKFWKMIYYLFIIIENLNRFKPDLVYFTLSPIGYPFYRDCIYVAIIKCFKVQIVYHLHGKGIINKSENRFNRLLYNFVFKCSKVILLSPLLLEDVLTVISKKTQIIYLANGIKTNKRNFIAPSNHNDPPVILFLSNIEKTKGVLVLLDAVGHLAKKKLKFTLKLVGGIVPSIPKKDLIKRLNKLKGYVDYLGPIYGNEKYNILISSDIFVFPTYYTNEAFPLVLLEAMQAGLPIISTFEGAIPEIVKNGDNGFLVKQRDSKALADKLESLLKDENLRERMGKSGQQKFLNSYTSEIFETKLNNIFHEILHEDKKMRSGHQYFAIKPKNANRNKP